MAYLTINTVSVSFLRTTSHRKKGSYQSSPRPFVSLTQAAKIAEEDKNRVKGKDYLLPKTSNEDAERRKTTIGF
jgi:hypothetical protein